MKRLAPGKEIARADGRRMLIERVTTDGEIRVVHWRQIVGIKAAA